MKGSRQRRANSKPSMQSGPLPPAIPGKRLSWVWMLRVGSVRVWCVCEKERWGVGVCYACYA